MYLDGGTTLGPDVQGTRIRGDVAIFGGGFVEDAHIGGSVFLLDAYGAGIRGSYVGGDIWTGNGFGATHVTGNEVGGSILLDGAGSDEVIASDNMVGGDLSISRIGGNFNFDGNEIAGNLRLVDASPYNFVASTVRGNQVGGRLEIARNRLADFPENPPELAPTFIVADNVVGQHAGMFENDGLQLLGNVIGGVLLCQGNGEFTQSGNVARGGLGQCQ